MDSMIEAYHVSSQVGLNVIHTNYCDDEQRDGLLLGAKVACFTTTRVHGHLPTISPYPRNLSDGSKGYRYVMKFNPDHFFKFPMASTQGQVHFLLLKKASPRETKVAEFVEMCVGQQQEGVWETYFPGGKANEYNRDVFVNVMFWHPVAVEYHGRVTKNGAKFDNHTFATWFARLLTVAKEKANANANVIKKLGSWVGDLLEFVPIEDQASDAGNVFQTASDATEPAIEQDTTHVEETSVDHAANEDRESETETETPPAVSNQIATSDSSVDENLSDAANRSIQLHD